MQPQTEPVVPAYDGPCVTNLMAQLLEPADQAPGWWPAAADGDGPVVLLVLDGLGWEQLDERRRAAPLLSELDGGPITTIAPSTTASALTSISTGLAPGEHGIVGYRMMSGDEVLNVLRWSTPAGDARSRIEPEQVQIHEPFLGHRPPVVSRAEFATSGFTRAHLRHSRLRGYRVVSSLVCEVDDLLRSGEPFVYAYYDGLDKVSHEYGLGHHFEAEVTACDRLVADLCAVLPPGGRLVVTADHGQVDTGDALLEIPPPMAALLEGQSGEARFRWLHAGPGQHERLRAMAEDEFGAHAWVRSRAEIIADGWFGGHVEPAAEARLGDVALVSRDHHAFVDQADSGLFPLLGRHGSLTSAEMYVPLLAFQR